MDTAPRQTQRDWKKHMLSFEPRIYEALKLAAHKNYRSFAAEVRFRLERSLEEGGLLSE